MFLLIQLNASIFLNAQIIEIPIKYDDLSDVGDWGSLITGKYQSTNVDFINKKAYLIGVQSYYSQCISRTNFNNTNGIITVEFCRASAFNSNWGCTLQILLL